MTSGRVSRGTVFQEMRPGVGFETGDFVKEKLGGTLEFSSHGSRRLQDKTVPGRSDWLSSSSVETSLGMIVTLGRVLR